MTKRQTTKASKPTGLARSGPRGLAGYCWAEHPSGGVHCCNPVGHETRYPEHDNPYTKPATRWT